VMDVLKSRRKGTITTIFRSVILCIILRHISTFIKTIVRHLWNTERTSVQMKSLLSQHKKFLFFI
jgi:hypothetical protein